VGDVIGVDLGTVYTAAAIALDGRAEIVHLGDRSASIPSVVCLTESGEFLIGDDANRRALSDPGRVAREFKRRFGDPVPVLIGAPLCRQRRFKLRCFVGYSPACKPPKSSHRHGLC
jgi:hypothetical protein